MTDDGRHEALRRLDAGFVRMRRWTSRNELDLEEVHVDLGLSTDDGRPVHPAKVAACEAVAELGVEGRVTVKDVAAFLSLDASTASRLLGECDALGLVRRAQDPDDRRRVLLEVTDEGRRLVEATGRVRLRVMDAVLADWDRATLEEFARRFDELTSRAHEAVADLRGGHVPEVVRDALAAERADHRS